MSEHLALWARKGASIAQPIEKVADRADPDYNGRLGDGRLNIPAALPSDDNSSDLDQDGSVTVPDLLILLGSWGPCGDCADCPADLNDDCDVAVADLLILLVNWS